MGYVFMRFGTDFKPENVDRLRIKVGECLDRCNIYGTTAFLLLNMMDELICNILEHSKASWVEVDDGPQFDPSEILAKQGSEAHLEKVEDRNMGLYMVGHIARSWDYSRINGQLNELRLVVDLERSEVKK